MDKVQLLQRVDRAWEALRASYAGLSDAEMVEPGVTGDWSIEDQIARETRFRRRLRLDTYGHYPEHAEAIRKWRERRSMG